MTLRYLLLFSVAVLSILRPSHVKQVDAASVTTNMKATTAVALVGFATLQRVNAGYDCRNAPTGDPNTQCSKNECCSASETCSGATNAGCPNKDSDINVSCWACCGTLACNNAAGATIGVGSCNGNGSCHSAKRSIIGDQSCRVDSGSCHFANDSNIGNHSCRGYSSCQYAAYSNIGNGSCQGFLSCWSKYDDYYGTIGDNSCNNDKACVNCSDQDNRSTVPINSCNEAGWKDSESEFQNVYWNICPYCKSSCKIQATGESCNASTLQATATVSASYQRKTLAPSYSSKKSAGSTCSVVETTIMEFIHSHDDFENPLIQKLIHKQATIILKKSKKKNANGDDLSTCVLDFDLTFFHLGTPQEIDSRCKAFEGLFSNADSRLMDFLRSKSINILAGAATCIRKDINAEDAKDPKKRRPKKNGSKPKKI